MPFQSEKQRRYLWANEPEIARDWTDTYGSGIAKALGGRIPFYAGSGVATNIDNPVAYDQLAFNPGSMLDREIKALDVMPDINPSRYDQLREMDMKQFKEKEIPLSLTEDRYVNNPNYHSDATIVDDITNPIDNLPFNIDWLEKTYGKGINQIPNQFKNMYWGPSQGDEAGNVWEEPAPKPFSFPGIIGLIQSLARGAGKKLGMTQVSDADRTANEAFMGQQGIYQDPQTGRMIGGDFAGRNAPGTSGWGSANFGEMAQSWMDKYGEVAYKTDKMKEKKARIAKIARDHQRKLQQEREQTIKDYSTWTSPRGRDHVTTGGIGSPESKKGAAPGTSKGEASWKGYQGGLAGLWQR